ncbi:Abi family protein [Bacillus sp. IITD106]|nr:Abi family protein [Bacillus sp. IITD106]
MDLHENFSVKVAKTFEEQLIILQNRGVLVEDSECAINTLQRVNYYRLVAYGLTLKNSSNSDTYMEGTTFSKLVSLYEFDKKLRQLLIGALESVEIAFRTHIAYHHAHNYSPLGYENPAHFQDPTYHERFIKNLERFYDENKTELFIIHHRKKYDGVFPFWVAIEVLSFSTLSMLFKNLLHHDKLFISKTYYNVHYKYTESWLHTLATIRNVCAHHGRLYGKKLPISPQLFKKQRKKIRSNSLFAAIIVLFKLLNEKDRNILLISLQALIDEYKEYINLSDIGFTHDWESIIEDLK